MAKSANKSASPDPQAFRMKYDTDYLPPGTRNERFACQQL
jgi:hypothetical protein